MGKESMVFYKSFFEAIKDLDPDTFKSAVVALLEYGLEGIEYTEDSQLIRVLFSMAKPVIDANNKKRENGKKGGEANRSKPKQAEAKESKPKQTEAKESKVEKRVSNEDVDEDVDVDEDEDIINARARNTKPTIEEIRDYCQERKNSVDPQRFFDHYESNGWMVGKTKMKDWRAAVRTWERSEIFSIRGKPNVALNYQQREYSNADLESRLYDPLKEMV